MMTLVVVYVAAKTCCRGRVSCWPLTIQHVSAYCLQDIRSVWKASPANFQYLAPLHTLQCKDKAIISTTM